MSTVPFPSPPLCREKIERIHLPIFIPEPHSHTSLADVSTPFLAFSPVLKPSSPARAFEPRCSPTTIRASFLHINQLLANREEWGSGRVRKIQTSPFLPSFYHHLSRVELFRSSFSFRVGLSEFGDVVEAQHRTFRLY